MSDSKIAIVINGPAQTGKDTFVELCQEQLGNDKVTSISSIDPIKDEMDAKDIWHWGEPKTDEIRDLMSQMKKAKLAEDKQAINKLLVEKIQAGTFNITFVHIREPEQITLFRELCDIEGITNYAIHLCRTGVEVPGNESDTSTLKYPDYNFYIRNDGTLEDLRQTSLSFLQSLGFIDNELRREVDLGPNISRTPFPETDRPPEQ